METLTYTDLITAAVGLFSDLKVDVAIAAFIIAAVYGLLLRKTKTVAR